MTNKTLARSAVGMLTILLFGCSQPADPEAASDAIQILFDFDGGDVAFNVETARAEIAGGALDIDYSPDADWSVVRLRPETPWDWSELQDFNFALDVSNRGTRSTQMYVSLTNSSGDTSNWSANIPVGSGNTYFFILDGPTTTIETAKRENPEPWSTTDEMMQWRFGKRPMALDGVTEVALGVRGSINARQLRVDNIRLRRNVEHDLSFLEGIVDEFGQNAKEDFPIKVHSLDELKAAADRELAELAQSGPLPDRSRWGGWKDGPKLEATGFFRVEKVNGKWWMVDPDGHIFFSNGLANVRMANLTTFTGIDFEDPAVRYVDPSEVTPEDSIGIVDVSDAARETRYVANELRHKMFTWLPDYGDELADHYSFRRSAIWGPMDGGETYSFYRANVERRYGETEPESYIRKWEQVTLDRMNAWGFTSFGNWVDPAFYPNEQVPYFANGWIIGDYNVLSSPFDVWAPMPDPFDPEFVKRADITIAVIADEIQGSPWCVGIFVDNEKSWGRREGTVEQRYGIIIDGLRKSADESPAKSAFTGILKDKYASIVALNEAWETAFTSWDELANGVVLEDYTDAVVTDMSSMLEALSHEYFRVVHDAVEKYLPNHLYMGARMASWGMPEETVKAAVKYSDVLSFNIYKEGMQPYAWEFLDEIDLPTIIGEFHIGATSDTGLFHPGLVHAADQADRAQMYLDYMETVIASPFMVGAHWFQYVDSPLTGRAFDGEGYNVGFVTVTDIPYPEMVDAAKTFNTSLYPKRFGATE